MSIAVSHEHPRGTRYSLPTDLLPTSRLGGVLLHGAALGGKGSLAGLGGGAGEAALHNGRAQGAQDLALGEHGVLRVSFVCCSSGSVVAVGVESYSFVVGRLREGSEVFHDGVMHAGR